MRDFLHYLPFVLLIGFVAAASLFMAVLDECGAGYGGQFFNNAPFCRWYCGEGAV